MFHTINYFLKDVKATATNDDQYFVFEDLLYQVSSKSNIYAQMQLEFLCSGVAGGGG